MNSIQTPLRRTFLSLPYKYAYTHSVRTLNSASMASVPTTSAVPTPPWHAACPAPRNSQPEGVTRHEVLAMLKTQLGDQTSGRRDFILLDLRRTDLEVWVQCRAAVSR
jgi:hypothetical protein